MECDRIAPVFKAKHVLVTGGTGFMGKVLIEKLLRVTDVGKIYMLMRAKKGKSPSERLSDMFSNPLFDLLKKQTDFQTVTSKIRVIVGDVAKANLDLSTEDRRLIIENVNLVYHCAATIRFDEKLKVAVELNARGTKLMVELALQCKKLDVFGYMSTAFIKSHEVFLLDKPYEPPADPLKVIESIENFKEHEIDLMEAKILETAPNTYVYTKALAESIVNEASEKLGLRAVIIRPSIVLPTYQEPMPGWNDNINGPTGYMIGIGQGVIRSVYCETNLCGNFVPVDLAINGLLVSTWHYLTQSVEKNLIVNCASPPEARVTWRQMDVVGTKLRDEKYPANDILWYPRCALTNRQWLHRLRAALFHWLPALIIDTLVSCFGYKPFLWKIQDRIAKGMEAMDYFATHQWNFDDKAIKNINKKLNDIERKKYKIDAEGIDGETYFGNCILGARRYVVNQSDDRLPQARIMMKRMFWVDRICKAIIYGLFFYWITVQFIPMGQFMKY